MPGVLPETVEVLQGERDGRLRVDQAQRRGQALPDGPFLDVDLALVAARLGIELRVPGVPQVRVRDVGYANYGPAILPGLDLS